MNFSHPSCCFRYVFPAFVEFPVTFIHHHHHSVSDRHPSTVLATTFGFNMLALIIFDICIGKGWKLFSYEIVSTIFTAFTYYSIRQMRNLRNWAISYNWKGLIWILIFPIEFPLVDQSICGSLWNGRSRSNKAKEGFILPYWQGLLISFVSSNIHFIPGTIKSK